MLLLKNLTIFDNNILAGYLAKFKSHKVIDQRALTLMEKMEVSHLRNNNIDQVSGGQLQRAAICRALINDPDIIFGDEPTGALNSSAANNIMQIFADINLLGKTILLVTHDVKVAAKTERVLYIFDGNIVAEKKLEKYDGNASLLKDREKALTDWLNTLAF
jgi:putative ABC transport system ATP-binding protein